MNSRKKWEIQITMIKAMDTVNVQKVTSGICLSRILFDKEATEKYLGHFSPKVKTTKKKINDPAPF